MTVQVRGRVPRVTKQRINTSCDVGKMTQIMLLL